MGNRKYFVVQTQHVQNGVFVKKGNKGPMLPKPKTSRLRLADLLSLPNIKMRKVHPFTEKNILQGLCAMKPKLCHDSQQQHTPIRKKYRHQRIKTAPHKSPTGGNKCSAEELDSFIKSLFKTSNMRINSSNTDFHKAPINCTLPGKSSPKMTSPDNIPQPERKPSDTSLDPACTNATTLEPKVNEAPKAKVPAKTEPNSYPTKVKQTEKLGEVTSSKNHKQVPLSTVNISCEYAMREPTHSRYSGSRNYRKPFVKSNYHRMTPYTQAMLGRYPFLYRIRGGKPLHLTKKRRKKTNGRLTQLLKTWLRPGSEEGNTPLPGSEHDSEAIHTQQVSPTGGGKLFQGENLFKKPMVLEMLLGKNESTSDLNNEKAAAETRVVSESTSEPCISQESTLKENTPNTSTKTDKKEKQKQNIQKQAESDTCISKNRETAATTKQKGKGARRKGTKSDDSHAETVTNKKDQSENQINQTLMEKNAQSSGDSAVQELPPVKTNVHTKKDRKRITEVSHNAIKPVATGQPDTGQKSKSEASCQNSTSKKVTTTDKNSSKPKAKDITDAEDGLTKGSRNYLEPENTSDQKERKVTKKKKKKRSPAETVTKSPSNCSKKSTVKDSKSISSTDLSKTTSDDSKPSTEPPKKTAKNDETCSQVQISTKKSKRDKTKSGKMHSSDANSPTTKKSRRKKKSTEDTPKIAMQEENFSGKKKDASKMTVEGNQSAGLVNSDHQKPSSLVRNPSKAFSKSPNTDDAKKSVSVKEKSRKNDACDNVTTQKVDTQGECKLPPIVPKPSKNNPDKNADQVQKQTAEIKLPKLQSSATTLTGSSSEAKSKVFGAEPNLKEPKPKLTLPKIPSVEEDLTKSVFTTDIDTLRKLFGPDSTEKVPKESPRELGKQPCLPPISERTKSACKEARKTSAKNTCKKFSLPEISKKPGAKEKTKDEKTKKRSHKKSNSNIDIAYSQLDRGWMMREKHRLTAQKARHQAAALRDRLQRAKKRIKLQWGKNDVAPLPKGAPGLENKLRALRLLEMSLAAKEEKNEEDWKEAETKLEPELMFDEEDEEGGGGEGKMKRDRHVVVRIPPFDVEEEEDEEVEEVVEERNDDEATSPSAQNDSKPLAQDSPTRPQFLTRRYMYQTKTDMKSFPTTYTKDGSKDNASPRRHSGVQLPPITGTKSVTSSNTSNNNSAPMKTGNRNNAISNSVSNTGSEGAASYAYDSEGDEDSECVYEAPDSWMSLYVGRKSKSPKMISPLSMYLGNQTNLNYPKLKSSVPSCKENNRSPSPLSPWPWFMGSKNSRPKSLSPMFWHGRSKSSSPKSLSPIFLHMDYEASSSKTSPCPMLLGEESRRSESLSPAYMGLGN